MSFRTNPDRILENIDRARNRDAESAGLYVDRQAMGRDLDTTIPDLDATTTERLKRIFQILERAYTKAAGRTAAFPQPISRRSSPTSARRGSSCRRRH